MSRCADLARDLMRCYDAMDADALEPLLHPRAKHTAPGSNFGAEIEGAALIADYFRKNVFPAFHAVRFEIVNLFEDPEKSAAIVEWRSHLKPKTGRDYVNTGVFVIENKDGRIYWVREYFDTERAHQHV